MMNKDKETMAQDYVRSLTESGDVKFSYSFTRMINSYLAGFDAGKAKLLEQASGGFKDWESRLHEYETYDFDFFSGLKAWQASQISSAKLLAEKDAEIEQIEKQVSWYLSLGPADKKSFGDLIVELKQAKDLLVEKDQEIARITSYNEGHAIDACNAEENLQKAKELIKGMRDALRFYAKESNWRDIVEEETYGNNCGLERGCFDSIIYEDCENDIGGKLARKTLKDNTDKIKALLGEE
jgi:hypothetical protein